MGKLENREMVEKGEREKGEERGVMSVLPCAVRVKPVTPSPPPSLFNMVMCALRLSAHILTRNRKMVERRGVGGIPTPLPI